MPQGSLYFSVRTADSAFPVADARIRLFTPEGVLIGEDRVSGGGPSREFFIDAPDAALSLRPESAELPYGLYNARIDANAFYPVFIRGIQIFAGQRSHLPLELIPSGAAEEEVLEYDIGPHALRSSTPRSPEGPGEARILGEVFIPQRVTVHLGTPESNAQNVTVPFIDYVKNVASSEIYPTWPENSLRANILCQISFLLNRVFTEWYPSRGYNFNITNSTAFDQYFVYGRNIFDSISRIVDEIFNEYIRRPGRIDPYFAEYCNGTTVTCAGLSQWGTVPLAREGRSTLEILQFYYGDVEISSTNNIRAIESSYPGTPLRRGSEGKDVRTIQQQLNRIRVNYPAIPAITSVDGIFGTETENAVKRFQQIFDLTPDGVVGKRTWYRISYIYVAVKRLGELNSEGERPAYDDTSFPGILRIGDTGTAVQSLQFYLKSIAAFNPFLPDLAIDGFFGSGTDNAVKAFQRLYGLNSDGVVGEATWNRIIGVYLDVTENGRLIIRPFPGTLLRQGSTGEDVLYEQLLLNRLRPVFVTVRALEEDSIFGSRMRSAVREFQRLFGYRDDGVIGRDTWNGINRIFGSVRSGCFDNGAPVSGRTLRIGSEGTDVAALQNQLNRIGTVLSPIPSLRADGAFGNRTREAVTVFQRIFGLTADGVVGTDTRTKLATVDRAREAGCFPSAVRLLREESEDRNDPHEAAPYESSLPWEEENVFPKEFSPALPASSLVPPLLRDDLPAWKKEFLSRESIDRSSQKTDRSEGIESRFLSVGDTGQEVLLMKELLGRKGYLNPRAEEEGAFFGPSTARAILSFQEDQGLIPTAAADPETLRLLSE